MRIIAATLIGFVVTCITIVLVPLLLNDPASRSVYFWQRIVWTEFLAALIWAYIGGFFSLIIPKNRSIRGLGGVLPALGIVIFFYSISSFIMMMIAAYFPQINYLNMASQIYRAAGLIVVIIFLFFSWISGMADTNAIPEGVRSPKDLIIALQSQENALLSQQSFLISKDHKDKVALLINSLKSLREKIQYSIPHVGKIGSDNKYVAFSNDVIHLCETCSALNVQAIDIERIQSDIKQISVLNSRVQSIAHNLRN